MNKRTRDNYMRLARAAKVQIAQENGYCDTGVVGFFRPVAYYVQKAREQNNRLVTSQAMRSL